MNGSTYAGMGILAGCNAGKERKLSLTEILRTFFPMECPLCGGVPFDDSPGMFCADCLLSLEFTQPPYCPGCGGRLSGILELCPDCLAESVRPWKEAFALFQMSGLAQEVIHRYKYRKRPELARALGQLAAGRIAPLAGKIDFIVPTPLHWTRFLQRGFNQAALFSEGVSKRSGLPIRNVLRRIKRTKQQARLKRDERLSNLKGAFSVTDSTIVQKRAILLTDDVMTTGSTLSAAAQTLLEAGASDVYVLVIARRQRI